MADSHTDYPHEIDLGRKENFGPVDVAPPAGKKGKKRVHYPTLYIENVEGLPALPKEGCMMVKFRRKSMRVEENGDGKETAGMTLEIRRLCLPEDMGGEDGEDMASAMAKFAKESGVADADKEDDDETDDDEGEE